jgi:inner membrane protein
VVYRGALKIAGAFARPSFETWKVDPNAILWDDATLSLAITDLRGTQGTLTVRWAEQSLPLEPGCRIRGFDSGVSARIPGLEAAAGPLMFDLDLNLKGSFSLGLIPAGRTTEARLKSEWPDPRFDGAFLPAERTVTPDGFQARWEVSYYGRMFPQRWSTADGESRFDPNQATASAFRVSLLSVVDAYRLTERSIKYGVLFLVLVFTTFFLFEAIASLRVHPVQYALVGAALCLFYLILLSLSEFIRFSAAYALAALAATGLIAAYCARVLHKRSRAVLLGAGLLGTYGCLYVILQMQDYSLLLGTAGLFLALGLVMFLTRNLDWYGQPGDEPPAPPTPDCTSQAP